MSTPVKNNQTPPPQDPYSKNYGSDPYANAYGGGSTGPTGPTGPTGGEYPDDNYGMDDSYGEGSGDNYVGEDLGGDPNAEGAGGPQGELSATSLRDMAGKMKKELGADYATVWGDINKAAGMSPGKAQQEAFAAIATKMNELAYPPDMGGVDGTGEPTEDDLAAPKEELKKQVEDLKSQIQGSDLSDSAKTGMNAKLERALSSLDLKGDSIDQAQQLYDEVNQDFSEQAAIPKAARDLADKIPGKTPQDVADAAKSAGVDLDHLPQPPADMGPLMKMLNQLGVPADGKIDDWKQLKTKRDTDISNANAEAKREDDNWHADSESDPSQGTWSTLNKYFTKNDDDYKKMQDVEVEMGKNLIDCLTALGYTASKGDTANQVKIGDTNLDFFNEDSTSYTLTTTHSTLTQKNENFYPAPRNTEAGNEGHIQDMAELGASGYPMGASYEADG
ncbi:MAG: hypothetical protein K8R69_04740 [Deltaproteobacteria bacterium]|nr:hypothetical protein [Deltaproteobacteria bacterium]